MGGYVGPFRRDDDVAVNGDSPYRFGQARQGHEGSPVGQLLHPCRAVEAAADADRGSAQRRSGRPAMAVVVTADFFTPVVDDAYTFGRVAATNALSDIYAMVGEPLVAVNLLGWPAASSPASWRRRSCAAAWTWAVRRIAM